MQYIPIAWAVNFATFFMAAGTWSAAVVEKGAELFMACCAVFEDKKYVIFEGAGGAPQCYPAAAVSPWATGSAKTSWYYNATSKLFTTGGSDDGQDKRYALPYLSLEIVEDGRVQYDLTEFLEGIRIRSLRDGDAREYPSLPQILVAWTTSSGIVLHPTRFILRVITEEGETEEFTVDGKRSVAAAAAAEE